jgi:hypothetical protein
MKSYLGMVGVVLLSPTIALAQPQTKSEEPGRAPETLLPATSLVYFHFEGIEPHRKAYEQTALAQVLKGDLGEFLEYLCVYVANQLPGEHFKKIPQVLGYLGRKGAVVGFEVLKHSPLQVQVTVVFPEGGVKKDRELLFGLCEGMAGLVQSPVKEKKRGTRTVFEVKDGDFQMGWWQEGSHVVLVLGTDPVERILEVGAGDRPNLTSTALYKSVAAFKDYETVVRGYVDLVNLVRLLQQPGQTTNKVEMLKEITARQLIVTQLGLTGLKGLRFYAGFEGKAQRRTVILDLVPPSERKALLRLVTASADFRPAQDLPRLPSDAVAVSVHHVDWDTLYDALLKTVRAFKQMQVFQANKLLPEPFADLDAVLGINLRKDLLAWLDSTAVLFRAPSEGPYLLGYGLAVKVRDAKKLQESLNKMAGHLTNTVAKEDGKLSHQKRRYRGADLSIYAYKQGQDAPLTVSYTVHKGWLVISMFPQAVKGFILRSEGKHTTWKMPSAGQEALAAVKKKGEKVRLAAFSISDPRPLLTRVLAWAPLLTWFTDHEGKPFDVCMIPTAQSVTSPLFPNAGFLVDEGEALRWESYVSLGDPDWLVGIVVLSGLF